MAHRLCQRTRLSHEARAERRSDILVAVRDAAAPFEYQRIADYFGVSLAFVKRLARERAAAERFTHGLGVTEK